MMTYNQKRRAEDRAKRRAFITAEYCALFERAAATDFCDEVTVYTEAVHDGVKTQITRSFAPIHLAQIRAMINWTLLVEGCGYGRLMPGDLATFKLGDA